MPRPTKRTPAVVEEILRRISEGETLNGICRSEDKFPHPSAFRNWVDQDENLAIAYARAREVGFDAIAEEAIAIADATEHDTVKTEEGAERPNTEWITRSRLRVETRLKLLAKWDPRRYGEMTKIANADGSNIKAEVDETTKLTRLASIVAAVQKQAGDESPDDAG